MDNEGMKKCPYCAEMIKAEAIKCRYCGSNLSGRSAPWTGLSSSPQYWQRVREGKIIAGVCTGLARQFDSPILVLPLRLFFLLTAIFYGFGLILYVILWILMPPPTDTRNTGAGASYAAPPPPVTPPPPAKPFREEPCPPCPPVREEPCPPVAEGEPGGEANPEEPSKGEAPAEEPPRDVPPPSGPSGVPPATSMNANPVNGLLLLLVVLAGAAITFMLFNDSRFLGFHPMFHFSHSPVAEALKLLLVAGVVLVILAGMGFVALGIVPLALVAAGAVFLLQWMYGVHHLPGWIIVGSIAAAMVILIFFLGMRPFQRRTRIVNDER